MIVLLVINILIVSTNNIMAFTKCMVDFRLNTICKNNKIYFVLSTKSINGSVSTTYLIEPIRVFGNYCYFFRSVYLD